MRSPRTTLTASVVVLAVVGATPALAGTSATDRGLPRAPLLYSRVGPPSQSPDGPRQMVRVDADLLRPGQAISLELPLTASAPSAASLQPATAVGGYDHWSGSLTGQPDSTITLVAKGKTVSALVASAKGTYRITTSDDGTQQVYRVSEDRADDDLVLTPPAATPPTLAVQSTATAASLVDVLVPYTAGAATRAGGVEAVNALAALAVAASNDALAGSGVGIRFELVGTLPVTGTSTGVESVTLRQLTTPGDGSYDEVHGARDRAGADLVALLVDGGSFCGMAWEPGGASDAFSVIDQGCAVDRLSFPHELGHNLGASHDRHVEDSPRYPDAYGYVDLTARWRTIMAYDDACTDEGVTCPRIGRFSNPARPYDGRPTGIAAGRTGSADNAAAMNGRAAATAAYRTRPRLTNVSPLTPTRLVQSTGNLYWTVNTDDEFGTSSSSVLRTGKTSFPGTERVLYRSTAVDDFGALAYAQVGGTWYGYVVTNDYATRVSRIERFLLGGGTTTATTIATSPNLIGANDLVTDGTTLFWADSGGVRAVPIGGGTVRTLGTGTDIRRIALDTDRVYFATGSTVRRIAKAGGLASTVVSAASTVTALHVRGGSPSTVVWGELSAAVRDVAVGGSVRTLQGPMTGRYTTSVSHDGRRVLWTDCTSNGLLCGVRAESSSGAPATMESAAGLAHQVQGDSVRTFWSHTSGLRRYTR